MIEPKIDLSQELDAREQRYFDGFCLSDLQLRNIENNYMSLFDWVNSQELLILEVQPQLTKETDQRYLDGQLFILRQIRAQTYKSTKKQN